MWLLVAIGIWEGSLAIDQIPYQTLPACIAAREKLIREFPADETHKLVAVNCVESRKEQKT